MSCVVVALLVCLPRAWGEGVSGHRRLLERNYVHWFGNGVQQLLQEKGDKQQNQRGRESSFQPESPSRRTNAILLVRRSRGSRLLLIVAVVTTLRV
ncbi:hypothetical protein B0T16DRAFT_402027 [Cercophora newfieldiana]|uniref:Secreted protein n=1 Tax=Cercophora newfieldiana TaxID=92897 RepID=A0AA40CZP8_9PEZI|nr:hypothetical protein B0T16DRAFT_402027 [Cercophora newfieldiana]